MPTKSQLRACARTALEQRGFSVELIPGAGVVPGVRLKATKNSNTLIVAVRTSLRRAIGLMRNPDGGWKTIPNVDEVVAVTPATDDLRCVEVFGFDPKILIKIFDAALAAQLKRYPRLSNEAPIFVSLDEGRRGGTTKTISNLKAQAQWNLIMPLDLTTTAGSYRSEANTGFIERVKREFAELNGVDVSKVSVDFRINA